MTTDRLSLTRALEGSGMTGDHAERIATEVYDAIAQENMKYVVRGVVGHDHGSRVTQSTIVDPAAPDPFNFNLRFEELRHQITRMTIIHGIVTVAAMSVLHYWK